MATTPRAPKQWCLTKTETVTSFENWRQNLLYILSLDPQFAPFLVEGGTWQKKSKANPLRGFTDDPSSSTNRRTAQQKVNMLELMLGQIANYCPIISRHTIVKNSTSVDSIWSAIRLHFGFQATGAHFIDFTDIKFESDERPEDLYQRLMAFVEDNLLKANVLSHHGELLDDDEDLSPSLENFVVLTWLQLIHPELPRLVKQRYGTELRTRTLASIKPEISQALNSLLDEIKSADEAKVMRTASSFARSPASYKPFPHTTSKKPPKQWARDKSCPLCKQAGRSSQGHYLSECNFLPEQDRRFMLKARQIVSVLDDDLNEPFRDSDPSLDEPEMPNLPQPINSNTTRLVQVCQSPYIDAFYQHHHARIVIDSGATCNLIRLSALHRFGVKVTPSSQSAHQADGSSPMKVVGEARVLFTRDTHTFQFEALVVENLDVDILAGTPFMSVNDIAIRPAKCQVILGNGSIFTYGSAPASKANTVRRATVLRAPPSPTTIWPGEYLEIDLPSGFPADSYYIVEPRLDAPSIRKCTTTEIWPPHSVMASVAGKLRFPNLTTNPHTLKRHEHFCQIDQLSPPSTNDTDLTTESPFPIFSIRSSQLSNQKHSLGVSLDPDNLLPSHIQEQFRTLLTEYDSVFDPKITGYNGAVGPFQARVNMGPVEPPQRKGRLPLYGKDRLVELQCKFDELESLGVFKRPEDIDITVEYLNPSFLVKKPNGGHRLVTAFTDVGRYSKPQPSLMPDVDSTLRQIAQWKHIIVTDLTSAFYQIPLAKESMKYCGVATPYRGVRVYTRTAMGMPGSETALEELMCRVLGDLLTAGAVAKIADDLYCGGNTPEELLHNWSLVLRSLNHSCLHLSASKTVINPRSTTILGWIWSQGQLQASPHRVSTLASCEPPKKVSGMKSFIGAYKVLARVIPHCSALLSPLDDAIAGCSSQENVTWTDSLSSAFNNAQKALSTNRAITLPRPDDLLWIVTDGSVKNSGIAATLYIMRQGKLVLAGFFSAKLRSHQLLWLPCEIEALAIAAAIKHFSPYIIQSHHTACVLTDSKPCVQAFDKLSRGEFSASPRVATFLSTASRFQVSIQHVAGAAILPSDFASRNPPDCDDLACQICNFVKQVEDSVVRRTSTDDILLGRTKLPFTSRAAWLSLQSDCPDLRRTHAHLTQGTRPSKKLTNVKDVKRYLNIVTISTDSLLVVRQKEPLSPIRERIVVPRLVLDGLLTALHLKLSHPTAHQLKKVVSRYFYALDLEKAINSVTTGCHSCAALLHTTHTVSEQTTTDPPDTIGSTFAADILKRNRQLILVVRECMSSFTVSCLVQDEKHSTLRDALLQLCVGLCPLDHPSVRIRTDSAPAFKSLVNDKLLTRHHIKLEIGHAKNTNKNPVAERAIQELEEELLRQDPDDSTVSSRLLAVATAALNARIRNRGLSAREIWTQRDQFTNSQIPVADQTLILNKHADRLKNHPYSEKSKAPLAKARDTSSIVAGDLVYLYSDRTKHHLRDRYLVSSVNGMWCNVHKFIGQQLRSSPYCVKKSDCFKVPVSNIKTDRLRSGYRNSSSDSSDEDECPPPSPVIAAPSPPPIPDEIAAIPPVPVQTHCSPPKDPTDRPKESISHHGRPIRERHPPPQLKDFVTDF